MILRGYYTLISTLQQYLPFTVLKHSSTSNNGTETASVATVLTVYGIETITMSISYNISRNQLQQYLPFTVLKRQEQLKQEQDKDKKVATVLTVYGIETL